MKLIVLGGSNPDADFILAGVTSLEITGTSSVIPLIVLGPSTFVLVTAKGRPLNTWNSFTPTVAIAAGSKLDAEGSHLLAFGVSLDFSGLEENGTRKLLINVLKWLNRNISDASFPAWNNWHGLLPFFQLQGKYGFSPLRSMFAFYNEMRRGSVTSTRIPVELQDRVDLQCFLLSKLTGENLIPFYWSYNIQISDRSPKCLGDKFKDTKLRMKQLLKLRDPKSADVAQGTEFRDLKRRGPKFHGSELVNLSDYRRTMHSPSV